MGDSMKEFVIPEIELLELQCEEIITDSTGIFGDNELDERG